MDENDSVGISRADPPRPPVMIMTEPTGAPGYATPSPSGAAGPADPPARPTSVTLAFLAWVVMTALSLLSLVFVLTSPIWDQAVAAGLRTADVNGVQIDASTLVNTAKITSVVGFLIGAALYLLFACKMRDGRNWARVVLTIIGVLGVLSAVALALYMMASRLLPLGLFGLLSYVEPVLLAMVALMLGESIQPGQWWTYGPIFVAVACLVADSVIRIRAANRTA